MAEPERPIGWWVRRLDALLEEALDAAVAGEGLTRRHWQVLHSLAGGEAAGTEIEDALRDFPGDVAAAVSDLAARGWVTRPAPDRLRLTDDGAAAHDRVWRAVGRVRRHAADGLSRQEYERAITVLARMVENMERALGRG
ncbi:MarR family winged helix-turn-helix transcriptional regulator [Blastococcus sp. VKM Ac-2987]|uniref:MarR family winged helix-turn-helix transcriptional regulator n=1 Tax=Blastococcus sp. VKM Ac-2987 TaxID=3004141 RepID=UPI0022AB89AF|nr:MarR family winged helix-turn-helix transcriptional regulator [Blastococcus sp. VKM Ac-2987]MCZ2857518.1 MarR family winged helix-turn-helix transcriptional regulator [Blastococcus sp. VKM Ac-2987]